MGEKSALQWKKGFFDAVPIGLSLIIFGAIFGMLSVQAGLTKWESILMSLIVFAGSAQFTSLSLLSDHATIWTIVLTTLLINSRHLLMGVSLSPYYQSFSKRSTNWLAFFLIDEQYAITMNRFVENQINKSYILAVSLTLYATWAIGTSIGTIAGSFIPDPESLGLGFSFTALFIALAFGHLTSWLRIGVFLFSGIVAVLLVFILPYGLHLLIAGGTAFLFGYLFDHNNGETSEVEAEVN